MLFCYGRVMARTFQQGEKCLRVAAAAAVEPHTAWPSDSLLWRRVQLERKAFCRRQVSFFFFRERIHQLKWEEKKKKTARAFVLSATRLTRGRRRMTVQPFRVDEKEKKRERRQHICFHDAHK